MADRVRVADVMDLPPIAVTAVNAARFLQVSRQTIYRMVEDGRLQPLVIGSIRRFPVWQLERLANKPHPSMREAS